MAYPANCLRGLRSSKCREGELILSPAFTPIWNEHKQRDEASINWEDDEGSMVLLKKDTVATRWGVARLPREKIDLAKAILDGEDLLRYERDPIQNDPQYDDNPYHGNIVFGEMEKKAIKLVAGTLAMGAKLVKE